MPAKRYPVLLDSEQRESLIRLISIEASCKDGNRTAPSDARQTLSRI